MEEKNINETTETNTERTFTQKEVDEIIKNRLSKVKGNLVSDDEMDAFKKFKSGESKLKEFEEKAKLAEEKANRLEKREIIREKNISADFIDYVMFEAQRLTSDDLSFSEAVDLFLKENPQYDEEKNFSTGMRHSFGSRPQNSVEEKFYQLNPYLRK